MDIISYALCKKYSNMVALGLASATVDDVNKSITFTLATDGSQHTIHFNQPSDGQDGVSVIGISDKGNGKFTLLFSDGSESDPIQCVKGEKGDPGFSPTITENADNTDKIYKLDITTADSTFTTPNLKGADGQGGTGGGEANIIDSISVNGVNVVPDENKNVDITVPSIEGLTKDADLATVAKSGSYEDLSNKPSIPDITGLATETYVDNKIADYTKTADLADVATSGSYNDLDDKPTIPTVTDEYNAESSEAASGKAIDQAMSTLKGLPKPYFVFVDDDGKENFKTLYTDILQPRGIVGGLSIVFSSYTIDANKYLTQNEINEYSNLGWDVLCHSTDLNSLNIDTADAVLNYCDNRIVYYGFKKSNIFVYPNGNEGDNKIAIEEKVAKHFKYAFNINYSHNCPASIPLQNRMDIGRIVIPRASEITAEIKAYYKNLIDKTINENKLMIISTHSDKSDYTYLTELLDYILNQGYSFTSPVKALSEIDEYRFQNKLIPGDNISITPDNIISASFTGYDDTEVKENIEELNNNLSQLEYSEIAGGKNLANINDFKLLTTNPNRYGYEWLNMKGGTYTFNITNGERRLYIGYKHNGEFVNPSSVVNNSKVQTITISDGDDIVIWYDEDVTENTVTKLQLEEGSVATEYEPYIPSVKMLNKSLNNYALKSLYSDTTINVGRLANSTVGNYSTAEGHNTTASGESSHAEGSNTTASGDSSHAEGSSTTASGDYSHAEGKGTTASASYTHSEGVNTSAVGQGSHAEGSNLDQNTYNEIVFEDPRRVEIYDEVTGNFINITVAGSQAFGLNSHAEGCSTLAYGKNSHTEGYHSVAQAKESHAEGSGSEANGTFSHAEGVLTKAKGIASHAEGYTTTASGNVSHAEGYTTTASGTYSHAEGYRTTASNLASHVSGKYNAAMTTGGASSNTTGTAFVIGNGTGTSALSNAFSVHFDGTVKAKSTITASTTADYAEFFEWLDKNPNKEDRVGHFVTLDGDKIKIATSEDDYILGIVSGEPFVLGNGDCDTWNGMYLHDEFRRTMYEPAPKMIEILDSEGNPTGEYEEVEGEYEGTRPILNPDYDPTQEYVSRFDRIEWSPVGMLGVLAVLHDGTAEVNGYVTVNNEGIATKCTRDTRNSYRVIKKVSDKVVEVIFR